MNACPQLDKVELFLDGELSIPDADSFQRHLDGCPQCSEELTSLTSLRELLHFLPAKETVPFRTGLAGRIDWIRWRGSVSVPIRIAAVLVLGLALSLAANLYLALGASQGPAVETPAGLARLGSPLRPGEDRVHHIDVPVSEQLRILGEPVVYLYRTGSDE